jgi:RNA polymerase-binding transcription factor DksA
MIDLMTRRVQLMTRLRELDRRLRNGQYGVCVVCDAAIAEPRLDLLPDTPFCSTCAQEH